jgi:hypothetical protein
MEVFIQFDKIVNISKPAPLRYHCFLGNKLLISPRVVKRQTQEMDVNTRVFDGGHCLLVNLLRVKILLYRRPCVVFIIRWANTSFLLIQKKLRYNIVTIRKKPFIIHLKSSYFKSSKAYVIGIMKLCTV